MAVTSELVKQFLLSIESGEIRLTPTSDPKQTYNGIVHYQASNGWHLSVFVDCDDWDYVETIITDDGETLDFNALDQMGLIDYEPSESAIKTVYGLN